MRALRLVVGGVAVLALVGAAVVAWLLSDRPDLAATGVPTAAATDVPARGGQGVTVTWLGVTTFLFDDGETRLLTDGFFSRPGLLDVLLDRPVSPDLAGIADALAEAGITELAAVVPVHSHFDHAMDVGEVAKRTGAKVVGSPTTGWIARGANLPESQIAVLPDGGSARFGRFTVTLVRSRHAPIGPEGGPPFPGALDAPLVPPVGVSAWLEGRSFSIVIAHPTGTIVVQGSAGYVEDSLADVRADAVFLGVGGLGGLGRAYTDRYWEEIVAATGATRIFPVHWDDFTRPYGDIRGFPSAFAPLAETVGWLRELAGPEGSPVRLEWLPFGRPVSLFNLRRG